MSNIHTSITTLVISICRVGALLALLQMAAWVGGLADSSTQPVPRGADELVAGLSYLQSVGEPQLGTLVGLQATPIGPGESSVGALLALVREVTRALIWMLVLIALPLALFLGLSSPFLRQVDSYRMLFGTVALLGLLPLARAEAIPMPWVAGGLPYLPESLLAGGAVPLVTATLLGSAAILFDSRRLVTSDPRNALSPAASLSWTVCLTVCALAARMRASATRLW